jgi:hypothetical protein
MALHAVYILNHFWTGVSALVFNVTTRAPWLARLLLLKDLIRVMNGPGVTLFTACVADLPKKASLSFTAFAASAAMAKEAIALEQDMTVGKRTGVVQAGPAGDQVG